MMKNRTAVQHGGGWITNIGNAFLDIGSKESLREACPELEVHTVSVMNRWVSHHMRRGLSGRYLGRGIDISNTFNLQEHGRFDYVVQSGAFLGSDWFGLHGDVLRRICDRGTRLVINGGGMTDEAYTESEIEATRGILKNLRPYAFISRDEDAYSNFSDLAEHSYNGVDCAFFVSDSYPPMELSLPQYIVLNFDKTAELLPTSLLGNESLVIRTHHSFWHNFAFGQYPSMIKQYYYRENTMISENPHDYLDLYASASGVFSDRVHACIVTLAYGRRAMLFSGTPRAKLFERVGAKEILTKPIQLDKSRITEEKKRQVKFLSEILR